MAMASDADWPVDVRNIVWACNQLDRAEYEQVERVCVWLTHVLRAHAKFLELRADLIKGRVSEDGYDHADQGLKRQYDWLDDPKICQNLETVALRKIMEYFAEDPCSPDDESSAEFTQPLFAAVIEMCAHLVLTSVSDEPFYAWWRVFDPESKFYRRQRVSALVIRANPNGATQQYTTQGHRNPKLNNPNWLGHVDRFGRALGFDNIVWRCTEGRPGSVDMNFVIRVLRAVWAGRFGIAPAVLSEVVSAVFDAAKPVLLKMPDADFKRISTSELQFCMGRFRELLGLLKNDPLAAVEEFSPFRMDVVRRAFAADSLERRLNGMAEVEQLVTDVTLPTLNRADTRHQSVISSVLDFLLNLKVLNLVFGPHMHQELIKRVLPVLRFLADQRELTNEDLDIIWSSSLGKQETIEAAIHRLIAELAPSLPDEQLDHLMDRIGQLPLPNQDERVLQLLGALLRVLSSREAYVKSGRWTGIQVLWTLIQEPPGVSSETARLALTALLDLFRAAPFLHDQRSEIVRLCIVNVTQQRAVLNSYRMLQLLIGDAASMWLDLQRQHGLLQIIVQELLDYRRSLAAASSEQRAAQLSARLEFVHALVHLLMKAQEQQSTDPVEALSREHVLQIWDYLVKFAPTNEEQTVAFEWFKGLAGGIPVKEPPTATESVWRRILLNFGELDLERASESAFLCFDAYFLNVNARELKIFERWPNPTMVMRPIDDMVGRKVLWRFALRPADPAVAERAIHLINTLFEKLAPTVSTDARRTMIRKHLGRIFRRLQTPTTPAELRAADRCVTLLTSFVVIDNASHRKRKWVEPPAGTTAVPAPQEAVDDLQLQRATPSQLLAEESFEQLMQSMDALSSCPELARRIWQLIIGDIPKNPGIIECISNCVSIGEHRSRQHGELAWASLYEDCPVYLLHYILDIISRNIATEAGLAPWHVKFVETGGLAPLCNVLITNQALLQHHGCLSVLLQIIYTLCAPRKQQHPYSLSTACLTAATPPQLREQLPQFAAVLLSCALSAAKAFVGGSQQRSMESDRVELDVLRVSMALLGTCVRTDSNLLRPLTESAGLRDLLETSLMRPIPEPWSTKLADELVAALSDLCFEGVVEETPKTAGRGHRAVSYTPTQRLATMRLYLIRVLLEWLPDAISTGRFRSAYARLLATLLQFAGDLERQLPPWSTLVHGILSLVKQRPIEPSNRSEPDAALAPLFSVLKAVLFWKLRPDEPLRDAVHREALLYVFDDCLFRTGPDRRSSRVFPKCKTVDSRAAAFDVLRYGVENDWKLGPEVLMLLRGFIATVPIPDKWNFVPAESQRANGYVGIKNLGCICYAISLVQQLFMLPKFRRGVLSMPVEARPDNNTSVLMLELQQLFTFLQHSQRRYHDPRSFCNANTDIDGGPMNVLVQMDVDEYFNQLSDKIDNFTKGTPHEKLLQNIWGGKLSSQLICRGCPHRTEREEGFYTISLEIKDKRCIEQALQSYVKGDMLEGDNAYFCESCQLKRDTLKRSCIKSLPNTLILHLKRFEFDYQEMRKVKLNDYCSFPMVLDMEPYTTTGLAVREEPLVNTASGSPRSDSAEDAASLERRHQLMAEIASRPRSYYEYHLAGVIVHIGSSESGHYYSFIKERVTTNGRKPVWLEFNDKNVRPFDESRIAAECFGGEEEVQRWENNRTVTEIVPKARNAYMLIYERAQPFPCGPQPVPKAPPVSPQHTSVASPMSVAASQVERLSVGSGGSHSPGVPRAAADGSPSSSSSSGLDPAAAVAAAASSSSSSAMVVDWSPSSAVSGEFVTERRRDARKHLSLSADDHTPSSPGADRVNGSPKRSSSRRIRSLLGVAESVPVVTLSPTPRPEITRDKFRLRFLLAGLFARCLLRRVRRRRCQEFFTVEAPAAVVARVEEDNVTWQRVYLATSEDLVLFLSTLMKWFGAQLDPRAGYSDEYIEQVLPVAEPVGNMAAIHFFKVMLHCKPVGALVMFGDEFELMVRRIPKLARQFLRDVLNADGDLLRKALLYCPATAYRGTTRKLLFQAIQATYPDEREFLSNNLPLMQSPAAPADHEASQLIVMLLRLLDYEPYQYRHFDSLFALLTHLVDDKEDEGLWRMLFWLKLQSFISFFVHKMYTLNGQKLSKLRRRKMKDDDVTSPPAAVLQFMAHLLDLAVQNQEATPREDDETDESGDEAADEEFSSPDDTEPIVARPARVRPARDRRCPDYIHPQAWDFMCGRTQLGFLNKLFEVYHVASCQPHVAKILGVLMRNRLETTIHLIGRLFELLHRFDAAVLENFAGLFGDILDVTNADAFQNQRIALIVDQFVEEITVRCRTPRKQRAFAYMLFHLACYDQYPVQNALEKYATTEKYEHVQRLLAEFSDSEESASP